MADESLPLGDNAELPDVDVLLTTRPRRAVVRGRAFEEFACTAVDAAGRILYSTPAADHHLNPKAAFSRALEALNGERAPTSAPAPKANKMRRP